MINFWRLATGFIICGYFLQAYAYSTKQKELVLVSSKVANIKPISRLQIKKIFLGYPVEIEGESIYAVRNTSDDKIYEIFLQKLIHLSSKNYERRLLSQTFRTGKSKVLSKDSKNDLVEQLLNNKNEVSYMWRKEALENPSLKVLQVLWQGESD
ncbi:MAG: hypothetical protein KUG78_05935 [Kangiellaceae bacterium]|nr:hypothetical protein [Kangiellaceae bacterium]